MPIDTAIRSQGIGASEIAAILGMDPRRDVFSVWARKLELIDEPEDNIRMRKGRYFEQGIARWYSDETGRPTEWFDTTIQHSTMSWHLCTPDFWVLEEKQRVGGGDSKLVSWDQRDGWGEPGSDVVPDHYALQCQWTASVADKPWWDIAACLGDELRVYRVHRDPEVVATLLDVGEKFWNANILGRTQPPIGATDAAAAYLKKRFPKQVENLKAATPEQAEIMAKYKAAREDWDRMEEVYNPLENQIREMIGDAEGILHGPWKITWKKDADSTGTDWKAVAAALVSVPCPMKHADATKAEGCSICNGADRIVPPEGLKRLAEMEAGYQIITRHGPRKLRPTWGKKAK